MNKILARGLVGQRAVNTADERECGIAFVYVFVMANAEDKPLRCQLAIKPSAMVSILRFLYLRTNGGTNGQISRVPFREVFACGAGVILAGECLVLCW